MAFTPMQAVGLSHALGKLNSPPANGTSPPASSNGNPQSPGTKNRNLSAAQFPNVAQARALSHVSNFASSAFSNSSNVPNVGDPSYSPPNSIGTSLYS